MNLQNLISEADATKLLGLRPDSLRNMRAAGRGPAYFKVGKAVRYDLADLRAYVAASRVDPIAKRQPAPEPEITFIEPNDSSDEAERLARHAIEHRALPAAAGNHWRVTFNYARARVPHDVLKSLDLNEHYSTWGDVADAIERIVTPRPPETYSPGLCDVTY